MSKPANQQTSRQRKKEKKRKEKKRKEKKRKKRKEKKRKEKKRKERKKERKKEWQTDRKKERKKERNKGNKESKESKDSKQSKPTNEQAIKQTNTNKKIQIPDGKSRAAVAFKSLLSLRGVFSKLVTVFSALPLNGNYYINHFICRMLHMYGFFPTFTPNLNYKCM